MSKRSLLTGISLSIFGLTALAGAATAAPRSPANKHCILKLQKAGVRTPAWKREKPECFPTFSDAVFAATQGVIHLSEKEVFAKQLDSLDEEIKARQEALTKTGSVIVAVDYQDANYSSYTLTLYGGTPCTYTNAWVTPYFEIGWNDVFSSTRGYSYCDRNVLWEHANYAGASLTCWPDCPGFGALNDKISSQELHVVCDGTSGQWNGCRGTGCHVCSELVASYPCYFQNHPKCISNGTCGGLYYTCNKDCPAPTAADQC
jgi:hypothetical protein